MFSISYDVQDFLVWWANSSYSWMSINRSQNHSDNFFRLLCAYNLALSLNSSMKKLVNDSERAVVILLNLLLSKWSLEISPKGIPFFLLHFLHLTHSIISVVAQHGDVPLLLLSLRHLSQSAYPLCPSFSLLLSCFLFSTLFITLSILIFSFLYLFLCVYLFSFLLTFCLSLYVFFSPCPLQNQYINVLSAYYLISLFFILSALTSSFFQQYWDVAASRGRYSSL